ncbi:LpqB family beta-propeller domain-containing protein [Actinoplanes sp. NPDC026623]|uniref:LpqB family beta-propeller domain-containing protein n=1 Tax=Actinoplanes sp. NPDC026623 TaxID=3155610 RepID=UPI0033ED4FA8
MSPRLRAVLAAPLLVVLLLGGCGIPDSTDVHTLGAGPSTGTSAGDDIAPTRHGRESTLDARTFVQYYLEAAAGDPSGAMERVKEFLSPSAAAKFRAPQPPDITVVHLVEDPLVNPGEVAVTLRAQTIGKLGHNGILDPESNEATTEYPLTIGFISGKNGLFVTSVPKTLLISDSALNTFYDRRNLYFWDLEHTGLVPDVRYLSKDVPSEQAPNEVIKWLIDGPSPWLEDSVEPLPDATTLDGNVPAVSDDTLQVNLSGQAVQPPDDPAALDRLRRQLMWSLRPSLPRTLKLRVGSQDQHSYDDTDYLTSNLAYGLATMPERFVIYNGQVRRMARFPNAADPVPVLRPEANRNVRAAALAAAGDRRFAALVVGAGARQELRVAAARAGEQAAPAAVRLPGGTVGQPVWAITSEDPHIPAVGLVTVGGRLYSFASDGSAVAAVGVPGAITGITAVAVAPDGRRIALAAGGKVFIAALATNGDGVQVRQSRHILTSPLRRVTALDWSSETWLTVAGGRADRNRVAIFEVTIDGTQVSARLDDIGTTNVSYLTAYPVGPTAGKGSSDNVAYVANGAAFDVQFAPARILAGDLAQPSANPPSGVAPTAPFFLR